MARSRIERNSFVAGELTERLLGRTDLEQYQQGCLRVENATIMPHGGAIRRSGTRFVEAVKDSAQRVRLFSFQYNTEEAYVIEAGNAYFRFFAKGGQLIDESGDPVEVTTPYSFDDLPLVQTAQTADVMYLVHKDYPPYKLSRTSATEFSLDKVEFSRGRAPVGVFNSDTDNYISTNVAGGPADRTITMTKDTFTASDVGRLMYARDIVNKKAAFFGIHSLDGSNPTTVAYVTNLYSAGGADMAGQDTDRWALGLFSDTEGCNAVTFHEGRLLYGGFKRSPEMFWLSVSDDFDNFEIEDPDPDVTDSENADKAIQRRLLSAQVNEIRWAISAGEQLAIGTSGAEWRVNGGSDDILTPASTTVKRLTRRGSAPIFPAVIDNNVFFIQRNNARLREFKFSLDDDTYISRDTAILAEHLIRSGRGVRETVYQQDPDSILWMTRQDGVLLGLTIEREQQVIGAHRQILGGDLDGGIARVESQVVIPGSFSIAAKEDETGAVAVDLTSYMTNPSAEDGDLSGWTVDSGSWSATTTGAGQPAASEGSYFFRNSSTSESILSQVVDLTQVPDFNTFLNDEGLSAIDFSIMAARESTNGFLSVRLTALDASDNNIYVIYETNRDDGVDPYAPPAADTWYDLGGVFTLPRLTRKIKVELIGNLSGHTTTGSAGQLFDDMVFELDQTPIVYDTTLDANEDQLWVSVARTIGSTTKRYIEYFAPQYNPDVRISSEEKDKIDAIDNAEFMDSALELNEPLRISGITSANPGVVTVTAHGLSDGDTVRFRNIVGDLEATLDQQRFVVANATANTFTMQDVDTLDDIDTTDLEFIDNGISYVYEEVMAVSGMDHLEGQTVQILADGAVHPETVVTGGIVTLQRPASIIRLGLGYTTLIETFPTLAPSKIGSSHMRPTVSPQIDVLLHNTLGGTVAAGSDGASEEALVTSESGNPMDRSPPLFTGVEQFSPRGQWERLSTIILRQEQPLPFTVLSLAPSTLRNEG